MCKLSALVLGAALTALTLGGVPAFGDGPDFATTALSTSAKWPIVAAGDVDANGKMDLGLVDADGRSQFGLGNGDGTFSFGFDAGGGCLSAQRVVMGHLDGDARADTVAACADRVVILMNGLAGGRRDFFFTNVTAVAIADFDSDSKPDIAALSYGGRVVILRGTGAGSFNPASEFEVNWGGRAMTAGDFDGNGKIDLAIASSGGFSILPGNGDGTFGAAVDYWTGGDIAIASADFDRDGFADFVVTDPDGGRVMVLTSGGDATLGSPVPYAVGTYPVDVVVADLSGDGAPDLAVANRSSSQVSILRNAGDGTFAPAVHYPVGVSPHSLAMADFNGDTRIDLAVGTHYGSVVSLLLNHGCGRPAVGKADMDGDLFVDERDLDLIIAAYRSGFGAAASAPQDCNGDGVLTGVDVLCVEDILRPLDGTQTSLLDLDRTGSNAPLTDGLLLLRKLFGFGGSTLVQGVIGSGAVRTTGSDIEPYANRMGLVFDVDGDGTLQALTDGLLILRYLFGFRGATLINGVLGAGATRTTPATIEAYLAGL